MADTIKMPVQKFEELLKMTPDHVYFGILKREYTMKKFTATEWRGIVKQIKERRTPA